MKLSAILSAASIAVALLTSTLDAPNIIAPVAAKNVIVLAQSKAVAPAQPTTPAVQQQAALLPAPVKAAPFSRRDPVTETIAKCEPSVVEIRVPDTTMIGSGMIVNANGTILTNNHVLGGKKIVKVRTSDGAEYDGDVIAADISVDLAIVRISPKQKLKALTLADTRDLIKGERVIALGNPFGYEWTATDGRISGMNRAIQVSETVTIRGVIQTTAPINPGNSGGPLVNINGEVAGVVFALRDGAQNTAFAINTDTVKAFLSKHAEQDSGR